MIEVHVSQPGRVERLFYFENGEVEDRENEVRMLHPNGTIKGRIMPDLLWGTDDGEHYTIWGTTPGSADKLQQLIDETLAIGWWDYNVWNASAKNLGLIINAATAKDWRIEYEPR